ncbi:MAG TPA: hypothetical protein VFY91_16090 [Microbacterium sp.]|nr:hypothetical protein [Microbacterium sp.]
MADPRESSRPTPRRSWMRRGAALLSIVGFAGTLALAGPPARAVLPDQVGVFPTWSISGAAGGFGATATFPASAAFAPVTVATDATSVSGPSGVTGFLGASTAFGQSFGSTRSQPYLNIGTAAGQAASTTTLSFAGGQPDGWGFALGDVDADWVLVRAWADAARTSPLTLDQLGFQSVGNYCTNVPKPGSCAAAPYTDQPVWVIAPETFDGVLYQPGTLRGNSLPGAPAATRDTSGAYGWFAPTTDVAVIELLYGARDGFPLFQLWLASPAPKATITGTVTIPSQPEGTPVPENTVIQLNNGDGTPVLNAEDLPVQVPVAGDGSFSLETEQRPDEPYELVVLPPAGFSALPPITVIADSATPAPVTLEIAPVVVIPPAPPAEQPAAAETPELAESGAEPASAGLALALVVLGGALLGLRASRRQARSH